MSEKVALRLVKKEEGFVTLYWLHPLFIRYVCGSDAIGLSKMRNEIEVIGNNNKKKEFDVLVCILE